MAWWTTFALLSGIIWTWSLVSPLFVAPDEGPQITRAASAARGQVMPDSVPSGKGKMFEVRLPEQYQTTLLLNLCFFLQPDVPASCGEPVAPPGPELVTYTPYGNYPPLYYLLVGWPSLVSDLPHAGWGMRAFTAVICAAMVASAVRTLIEDDSRWTAFGLLVAVTPMSLWMFGVVNPNSIEIASALLLWVVLTRLGTGRLSEPRMAMRYGFGAIVLANSRPSSLLIVATVGGVVLLWAGVRDSVRELLHGSARIASAAIGAGCVLALAWYVRAHYPSSIAWASADAGTQRSGLDSITHALSLTGRRTKELVANVGYMDSFAPRFSYVVWAVLLGVVVTLGLVRGSRARRLAIVALIAIVIFAPALLEAQYSNKIGDWWQGRYTLPLAVGLPILAAATLDRQGRRPQENRWAIWGCSAAIVALVASHIGAFYWSFHRHTVGNNYAAGSLYREGGWHPPRLNAWLVFAVQSTLLMVAGALALLLAWRARKTPETSLDDDAGANDREFVVAEA